MKNLFLKDAILRPYRRLERFIAFRTYEKYNVIKIRTLKPSYYDKDTQLLHGMFQLLVDYVEVELANMEWISVYLNREKNWKSYLYWTLVPGCFTRSRSAERGLSYLDFYRNYEAQYEDEEASAKDTRNYGNEIFELYKWWTVEYPERKDPMDLSGWSEFCERNRYKMFKFKPVPGSDCSEMYDLLTEEEKEEERRILDLSREIEQKQLDEDTEMMCRLVKVRGFMWT